MVRDANLGCKGLLEETGCNEVAAGEAKEDRARALLLLHKHVDQRAERVADLLANLVDRVGAKGDEHPVSVVEFVLAINVAAVVELQVDQDANPIDLDMHGEDHSFNIIELLCIERYSVRDKGLDFVQCCWQFVFGGPLLHLRVVFDDDTSNPGYLQLPGVVLEAGELWDNCHTTHSGRDTMYRIVS